MYIHFNTVIELVLRLKYL